MFRPMSNRLVEWVVDPPSWAADRASLRRARVLPSEEGKATSTRILSTGRPRAIITSRDEWLSPCRAALRLAVGTEAFERADEELVEYFLDIAVDADRSRLAEFVLAESAGFYGDTADPCGPGPLDIPDAVADR